MRNKLSSSKIGKVSFVIFFVSLLMIAQKVASQDFIHYCEKLKRATELIGEDRTTLEIMRTIDDLLPIHREKESEAFVRVKNYDCKKAFLILKQRSSLKLNTSVNVRCDCCPKEAGSVCCAALCVHVRQYNDLAPIGSMNWLESIDLSGTSSVDYYIDNIEIIFRITKLVELKLRRLKDGNQLLSKLPWEKIPNLKVLELRDMNLNETEFLTKLPQLRSLDLSYNNLHSISGLGAQKALNLINVSCNPLDNLSDLSSSANLELIIADIRNLNALDFNLPKLKGFSHKPSHCSISSRSLGKEYAKPLDISSFANSKKLEFLNIESREIIGVNSLKDLTFLRWVKFKINNKDSFPIDILPPNVKWLFLKPINLLSPEQIDTAIRRRKICLDFNSICGSSLNFQNMIKCLKQNNIKCDKTCIEQNETNCDDIRDDETKKIKGTEYFNVLKALSY
ncbi:MAG: hypothetical protein HQK54_11170 [Oligoflexales bacterium]|nr:hypothetical protein [Oligoflexales bacterium]